MTSSRRLPRARQPARRPVRARDALGRVGGLALLLVAAVVVVEAAFLAWHAHAAYVQLSDLRQSLDPGALGTTGQPAQAVAGARLRLAGVADELASVRRYAAPLLAVCPQLGWLPVYGADIAAVPQLLDLGDHLTAAGLLLLDGLAPVVASAGPDAAPLGRLAGALAGLAQARPQLAAADARLAQAEAVWQPLQAAPLTPGLAVPLERVGSYLPRLRAGVQLAMLAPALLGADGARTYLMLAQNEDELRPTGGYISAAGLLTLDGGRITRLEFADSYAVDDLRKPYPDPPLALRRTMLADLWLFRDINWSPDFPTTARAAADSYAYGRGVEVDGVVALDQAALQLLLEGLGPVTVAATGETVSPGTVVQAIRAHWAPAPGQGLTGEWWQQRKSFLGDLAAAIRARLESDAEAVDLVALARAVERALGEKHLLVHAWQPEVASALNRAGWDGAIGSAAGDYLLVVDANVGFNKASPYVTKRIDYRVALDAAGGAEAHLALEYRHRGTEAVARCVPESRYDPVYDQMMERCVWNYVRAYVPQAARLEAAPAVGVAGDEMLSGEPFAGRPEVIPGENGTLSIGSLFVLAPGETMTLEYAYQLPAGVARRMEASDVWRYELLIQKQPGTSDAEVNVRVELPEGAALLASRPSPAAVTGREVAFRLDLREDRRPAVTYRLAGGE